ncbi:MAG: redoxin family protein [Treponema sp.]|jgi:cytochrome c-type biogenesis protein|nr:redoxin family protein [Treponema sp.]
MDGNVLVYALTCALAGLLSFLSPCVLPLIPSYLCVIGGTPPGSEKGNEKPRLMAGTASFILGFSTVFIVLSIIFSATFSLMGNTVRWINWVSGTVVIVLGLNIIFDFLDFLNYEKRFHFAAPLRGHLRGISGAFLTGAAFGAGWTPCVGPILAGVLLLAASGGIPRAVLYLVCYSAGLGLPFLLASIFFGKFRKVSAKLRPGLPVIRKISGALLAAMGVLIITGQYQKLNILTAGWQSNLGGIQLSAPLLDTPARLPTADSSASQAEAVNALAAAGLQIARDPIEPINFNLFFLDGTAQTLSDLKGNVVFLNFWATWCPPCRIEMPSMENLYQELKDRGLSMVAVNTGETAEQASAFMRESGLSFPVALDRTGSVSGQYGIQAIPTTYILDRRGLIVARMIGSIEWDSPKMIMAFEKLLSNPAEP